MPDPLVLGDVVPGDIGWVDHAVESWDYSARWSVRHRTPPLHVLQSLLWADVPLQQAVRTPEGRPVALLQLTSVDLFDGIAELSLLVDADHRDHLAPAVSAFLDRACDAYPLRQLTLATVEGELDVEAYLGHRARRVAVLPEHCRRRVDGPYAALEFYVVTTPEVSTCGE